MAFTYPLNTPTTIGAASITFTAMNAVAYSASPFTYQGQAHVYPGQAWQADITLPPCTNAEAEEWVAFLLALRGQSGTFLLGDPLNTAPRGTATTMTVTGAIRTSSPTATTNGTLKAGDWFSLGTSTNTRLYKVLKDKASGTGTLEIFPALRAAASNATADLTSAKGCFRLSSNTISYSIDGLNRYGITFGAMDVI